MGAIKSKIAGSKKTKNNQRKVLVEPDELVAHASGVDYDAYYPAYMKKNCALTREQTDLINSHWHEMIASGEAARGAGKEQSNFHKVFYGRLFELHPGLQDLFKNDMDKQGNALISMLSEILFMLPASPNLVTELERLAIRHIAYGAVTEHYGVVGEVLLYTLERCSEESRWTDAVKDAWLTAYCVMLMVIIPTTLKELDKKAGKTQARGG
mmetsp:Transcript_1988/g.2998  ORF Transcript_1988/g.2998 Transcript_1988/m.2998 type:complete len:211 (+) Transcript_1988:228-860(+)